MDLGSYREIANDLRAMIRDRVEDLAWRKKYPKSVIEEVSQILEEKAAGTFLWVGIACGELTRVQSRNAVKTLQALPRGLHSLYQKLLNAAVTASDEDDHRVIKEILGFVAFARRPLTLMEMAEACRLYLDKDMDSRLQFTREFIDLCRLLIVIDNGYVRLLHSSVQDFLLVEIREINAMKTNYALSCRCIETILQKCQPGMDKSEFDSEKGFLGYSILHWPEHARLSQTEFAIREEHKDFFQVQLGAWSSWLYYYNALKRSPWGVLGPDVAPIHVAAHWGILPLISSLLPGNLENKDLRGQSPLLIAAETVQIEAMHFLVECGSCVDSLNNYHENVLHVACQNSQYNNCAMTKFLLDQGTSPYVCDKDNMTPFLYTIGHQKEALARVFLQNGLDVNFRIQRRCWTGQMLNNIISYEMDESPEQHSKVSVGSGLTALHFSALNASAKMTALLLQYGADPNARSDTGDTPLHLAIRRTLLEHKYDDPWISGVYAAESLRDLITDHESETREIYESIDRYRVRIVETLLSSDTVDVNLANDQGDYPQHVIPFEKDYASSILCKLVAKGADSSRLNGTGQSCLHLASKAGNLEVVRKLVDEGHDIMSLDIDGLSPFHHALCGGYSEVMHFMSTACESLLSETWRSLDHFGKNPLHHLVASFYCSIGMVDFLVQRGCNVNDADREGNSALSLYMGSFCLHISREIFHILLDKGADPLCVNHQKENLAHLFMHHRGADIEILQLLLKCGVDPAARDHEGKTVMHHGAIHGAFTHELVEFLRVNGVLDPYARDFHNKTPLDYAEEQTRRIRPQDYPGWDDQWDKSLNCLKYWSPHCIA
jgi:ankyrin repeat protein